MISTLDKVQSDSARIFNLQLTNQMKVAQSTTGERRAKLKRLHKAVLAYKQEIRDALYKDFRKPASEVDLTEIYAVTSDIKHTIAKLGSWMLPRRVGTPLALLGTSSWVHYEPKGVVLVISPWNFPVNLTFGPVISAIAAGNCVIIKPSEHTPHASAIMKKIVDEVFDENEVALVEGDVQTSQELLEMPFNHIFFTGSPAVGKIVMKAAAKHLTSVTLELGGKSPTIIDETANLKNAASR
ncbi:aldehyde dehydrogenase family protein, partial [bacterium]|nr:aldehyde dehydrogenase family protein [bacterium]